MMPHSCRVAATVLLVCQMSATDDALGAFLKEVAPAAGDASAAASMADVPPGLSAEELNAAIAAAVAAGSLGLRLAPHATYRLSAKPGAALDGTATAILIRNAADFTLDCQGAELLLTGADRAAYGHILRLEHGTRVIIRNCRLDYDLPPFLQAVLIGLDAGKARFRSDASEPVAWRGVQRISSFDRRTGIWSGTALEWSAASPSAGHPVTRVSNDVYDVEVTEKDLKPGSRLVIGTSYLLQNQVYGANGVSWYGVQGLTIDNTQVFAAAGQGFAGQVSSDVKFVNGSGVKIRSNTSRIQSTNADGINAADQRGRFEVVDALFEGSQDDAINVYGFQVPIRSIESPVRFSLAGEPTAWRVGDTLEFLDESGAIRGTATTVGLVFGDGQTTVTLADRPAANLASGWLVANRSDAPTVMSVRGSRFVKLRGRGIVANTRKIAVVSNTFTDLPSNGAMAFVSNFSYFSQGPMPQSILIDNNVLRNVNTLGNDPAAIQIYALSKDGQQAAPVGQIDNVIVTRNVIENTRNMCVYASGVSRLRITGNNAAAWALSADLNPWQNLGSTCYGMHNASGVVGPNLFRTSGQPRSRAVGNSSVGIDARSR